MVEFIFFATKPALFAQEISHIKSLLLMSHTESLIITDRNHLVCLIPQLSKERSVVLLFASSNTELEDFVNIKELFGHIPTVLVLPDDNIDTLQRAMLLQPLYFMAKHAELSQYSLAINEICHIYAAHNTRKLHQSFLNKVQGAMS